jgi:hypothetical protein
MQRDNDKNKVKTVSIKLCKNKQKKQIVQCGVKLSK